MDPAGTWVASSYLRATAPRLSRRLRLAGAYLTVKPASTGRVTPVM